MDFPYAEPYKIKTVEAIKKTTKRDREAYIKQAGYNLFRLKSRQVFIDLLTDSGTGAMSDRQWAEIMTGDESYAGAHSFFQLKETVAAITGFPHLLPTHQGRAAENVLFSAMVKEGDIIPGNTHFDTTKGHIEFRKARAVDCSIDEIYDPRNPHPFKGNIDPDKLNHVIGQYTKKAIPFVIITITCNSGGGQPVSMENIRTVSGICRKHGIPLFIDAARFAENAYFIKIREEEFRNSTIKEIAREMFSYADGMTMSCKKDGIVNMGGIIALTNEDLYKRASVFNIMFEGYITYGGMSGRDMGALAQGLDEATEFEYLESRVGQVRYLSDKLKGYNVPVVDPCGGHAVFVDAGRIFTHIPQSQFPAQLLGVETYIEGGVRGVEIGTIMADRDPVTRKNRHPKMELLRLAIPRRVYTQNHMDYAAVCLARVAERASKIRRGFKILDEAPIMRHFTVVLDRAG